MDGIWEFWQGMKHVLFNGTKGLQAPNIFKEEIKEGEGAVLRHLNKLSTPCLHYATSCCHRVWLTLFSNTGEPISLPSDSRIRNLHSVPNFRDLACASVNIRPGDPVLHIVFCMMIPVLLQSNG